MAQTDGIVPSAIVVSVEESRSNFQDMTFEWGGETSINALKSESRIHPTTLFNFV
jgi:hypothetical protein